MSKNSGMCAQVQGNSTLSATGIVQSACANNDSQKWQFTAVKGGYEITNKNSKLQMDVNGGTSANGALLIQYQYHDTLNEMFSVTPTSDGYANIVIKSSGKLLDVAGVSKVDGAHIQQWQANGGDNQKWSFVLAQ